MLGIGTFVRLFVRMSVLCGIFHARNMIMLFVKVMGYFPNILRLIEDRIQIEFTALRNR
jgi:hypothetical protein